MNAYKHLIDKIVMSDMAKKRDQVLYDTIRKEKKPVLKVWRFAGVLAVCLAVVILANSIGGHQEETMDQDEKMTAEFSRDFTVTIMEAGKELDERIELVENKSTPVIVNNSTKYMAICGHNSKKGDTVSYCVDMPIVCTGDQLESITYKINKGAFQMISSIKDIPILGGKKYKEKLNVPIYSKVDEIRAEEYYTEYTIAADQQHPDTMDINICGIVQNMKTDGLFKETSLEKELASKNEMLDVVITCIATYKDGTTKIKKIQVKNKILKRSEAYPDDKNLENPDKKEVFVTFQFV